LIEDENITYFVFQSAFMNSSNHPIDTLADIKSMMEKSSRFISLSGWSGIAAGLCALMGAWLANDVIHKANFSNTQQGYSVANQTIDCTTLMSSPLFTIAIITFLAALVSALVFTYLRSKKTGLPMWGSTSRRLLINVSIPMLAGGAFILKLIESGNVGLVAPGCLIFYGLALINASKYTLGEVRYLGYGQLVLGIINCWLIGYGLYFWAIGFGIFHIVYGVYMWWKYERN